MCRISAMSSMAWCVAPPGVVALQSKLSPALISRLSGQLTSLSATPVWAVKRDVPVLLFPSPTTSSVTARLESTSPHYKISYEASLPNRDIFRGSETITGTTVGLRGLG